MIRTATAQDLDSIMNIIQSTIAEMQSYGNTQWDASYPQCADFQRDLDEKSLYVFELDGAVAAFACLNSSEPAEYAGLAWSSNEPALVIHRMAVAPQHRRCGIASQLLDFAATLAAQRSLSWLKTDTYSINANMNALFIRAGYRKIGEMRFLSRELPFYCYEKEVAATC